MAQINTVVVLRNDSTTAWEDSAYKLKSGEVGVGYMDREIKDSDGNVVETKKVPIIKVGDNEHSWKDLPQAEGVFTEDQILTYNFGRHSISNGFVNAGGKGMTTSEWLLDALSVTKDPAVSQPNFSLAAGTITTNTGNYEIGSKVKSVAWNGTFSSGSYEFGSRNGSIKYTDTATGVTASYNVTCDAGTFTSGEDGTVTLNPQVSLGDTSAATTIATVYNTCTWTDSPRTPVNNVGAEVASLKITGGNVTKDVTFTAKAYREGFFYGTTTTATAPAALSSSVIRGLANKTKTNYAKGTKNLTVPKGAATIILACPATSTGVTKVYNNTVNADMTTSFTKTANISVGGADASSTGVGDYAANYNVWTFTPNEAYGTETSLTITLG